MDNTGTGAQLQPEFSPPSEPKVTGTAAVRTF
jgi:hypothetical protein